MAVRIFFCYAREDEKLLKKFIRHLSPWKRLDRITMWYDQHIDAGRDWDWEIRNHLNNAQIIILLVSSDFIYSDFCYSNEMQWAMRRYERGEACVIPVILRPLFWEETPFGMLKALPRNGKPVTDRYWRNQDEALYDVAMGIHELLRSDSGKMPFLSASDMAILATIPMPVMHYISRRAVLLALTGLTVSGTGGVIAWLKNGQTQQTSTFTPVARSSSLQGRLLYTYRKHKDIVSSVSWSPDGPYIASGSYDKTVQVWEATKGTTIQTYRGHIDKVNAVMWSPRGTYIASASSDKTAHIWDATTGGTVKAYKGHSGSVTALDWSPDGTRIASASQDGTVQIWDAFTGKHILTYPMDAPSHSLYPITAVAWSSDGIHIASGNMNSSFDVWIAETGSVVTSGRTNGPPTLAWSPNGNHLAIGGQYMSVNIDNINGNSIYNYRDTISASVLSVAWSPDGQLIGFGGSDSTVRIWNPLITLPNNKALIYKYEGHSGAVRGVTWSPDSRYIASCSQDRTIQVWQ